MDSNQCKCIQTQEISAYRESGILSTPLLRHSLFLRTYLDGFGGGMRPEYKAFLLKNEAILLVVEEEALSIQEKIPKFQSEVWVPIIQPYYQSSKTRWHSGKGKDLEARVGGSAGRVLVTLEQAKTAESITLIFAEDGDSRGGMQSIYATKSNCLGLLDAATSSFPKLRSNRNISFGFN